MVLLAPSSAMMSQSGFALHHPPQSHPNLTPNPLTQLSRESFNSLTQWLSDARTLASPDIVIILVGNKVDLEKDRQVTYLEASRFAQENGEAPSPPPLLHHHPHTEPFLQI